MLLPTSVMSQWKWFEVVQVVHAGSRRAVDCNAVDVVQSSRSVEVVPEEVVPVDCVTSRTWSCGRGAGGRVSVASVVPVEVEPVEWWAVRRRALYGGTAGRFRLKSCQSMLSKLDVVTLDVVRDDPEPDDEVRGGCAGRRWSGRRLLPEELVRSKSCRSTSYRSICRVPLDLLPLDCRPPPSLPPSNVRSARCGVPRLSRFR